MIFQILMQKINQKHLTKDMKCILDILFIGFRENYFFIGTNM